MYGDQQTTNTDQQTTPQACLLLKGLNKVSSDKYFHLIKTIVSNAFNFTLDK